MVRSNSRRRPLFDHVELEEAQLDEWVAVLIAFARNERKAEFDIVAPTLDGHIVAN